MSAKGSAESLIQRALKTIHLGNFPHTEILIYERQAMEILEAFEKGRDLIKIRHILEESKT